ncbi:MAG TPA: arylesterase [Burkholderiales bacterium]|nr:arylesterase [Burkholderiales bacterium]
MLLPHTVLSATILVFGDSLSAGYGVPAGKTWVDLLQKKLGKKDLVVNASISGETTSGGLSRIGPALERFRPDIVVLELGANDGLRGQAVSIAEKNLESIVSACKRRRARVLLVGMRLPPNYGQKYSEAFREIYPEIAKRKRLAFVPFMLEGFAQDLEDFQSDGLHPTEKAQPKVLANIWKGLEPMLR